MHLAARCFSGPTPLADPAAAWWLWWRLRARWPDAIAACLMPDHWHLVVAADGSSDATLRLGRVLSGFTRWSRHTRLWNPIGDGRLFANLQHLERHVRYVHLNPCRASLVGDPLEWPWSTHRGVLGAEHDAWISAGRGARVCRGAGRCTPGGVQRLAGSGGGPPFLPRFAPGTAPALVLATPRGARR